MVENDARSVDFDHIGSLGSERSKILAASTQHGWKWRQIDFERLDSLGSEWSKMQLNRTILNVQHRTLAAQTVKLPMFDDADEDQDQDQDEEEEGQDQDADQDVDDENEDEDDD